MEKDVVAAFNAELASIYDSRPPISKNKIVEITKAALKAIKFYKHVVFSVEKFLGKCKAEYKIPCLYVIDSILRQSKRQFKDKDVFAARFAKNFDNTLTALLQCPPTDRAKIARTLNLWEANGVYPADKIAEYRSICQANGLDTDLETVEKAVKGENADLSIYERHGEKERRSGHHQHDEKKVDGTPTTPQMERIVEELPCEVAPPGGISECVLLSICQRVIPDIGVTVQKDLVFLRQVHQIVMQQLNEKLEKEAAANKHVSVKSLLSSNFDYSDEEDNEEDKEEMKAPPPPTQDELNMKAEELVHGLAGDIRMQHTQRMTRLHQAAMEAKRAEAQRAAALVIAQQREREQAIKTDTEQRNEHIGQHAIFSSPPKIPLPPGVQLPSVIPGLPQVSLAGNALGMIQGGLDNQVKMLSNLLGNPLQLLQGGPPPNLNLASLQNNTMLTAMRLNPQLLGVPPQDLQHFLQHPPQHVLHQQSQQFLQQPPPQLVPSLQMNIPHSTSSSILSGMNSSIPPPSIASGGNCIPLGMSGGLPPGIAPFSPNRPPPSLMSMDTSTGLQYVNAMSHEETKERDERRDGDERRRKRSRERDRHSRDKDRDDRRSDKEKKRRRSRSRERHGSRERDERGKEIERERRKMGLPSQPKHNTTIIASCTIWLGRLPQNVTEDELKTSIPELNECSRLQLMSSRACAYVTMRDRRSAMKLLERCRGIKVKNKEIKMSWAIGEGAKGDEWKSLWDEERGISIIPHELLPLDLATLCNGGWLDVSSLPPHLRGIVNESGLSGQCSSIPSTDPSSSQIDLTHVHLSSSSGNILPPGMPPIPPPGFNPFGPNINMGGGSFMLPSGMIPHGGGPPFMSPMGGPFTSNMTRGVGMRGRGMGMRGGRGEWRGARGGGWRGGRSWNGEGGEVGRGGGGRTHSRWSSHDAPSNEDSVVSSTTANDEHEGPVNSLPKQEEQSFTKVSLVEEGEQDMQME